MVTTPSWSQSLTVMRKSPCVQALELNSATIRATSSARAPRP